MGKRTPLYNSHVEEQGKIVDFAGWKMPVHYGSQIEEHLFVRKDAGMFDVSHMTIIDLAGDGCAAFLKHILANNVDRLSEPGKALYSCMLNDKGGVIDDLIVYYMQPQWYRMVVNAATREKDLDWLNKQSAAFELSITERADLAMIAVQGPNARNKVLSVIDSNYRAELEHLKIFYAAEVGDLFVARTGYTGEDGFEIILPGDQTENLWNQLFDIGIKPCGLGARDTLRLEAGMNLYGNDMDETTSPLESGLAWTIAWEPAERDFIGRKALEQQRESGLLKKFVGLVSTERSILRAHQKVVIEGIGNGETTSGGFSPSLGKAIALASVPIETGDSVLVEIRDKLVPAKVVKPPFVRKGKSCID